jgi:hypothetical protein
MSRKLVSGARARSAYDYRGGLSLMLMALADRWDRLFCRYHKRPGPDGTSDHGPPGGKGMAGGFGEAGAADPRRCTVRQQIGLADRQRHIEWPTRLPRGHGGHCPATRQAVSFPASRLPRSRKIGSRGQPRSCPDGDDTTRGPKTAAEESTGGCDGPCIGELQRARCGGVGRPAPFPLAKANRRCTTRTASAWLRFGSARQRSGLQCWQAARGPALVMTCTAFAS